MFLSIYLSIYLSACVFVCVSTQYFLFENSLKQVWINRTSCLSILFFYAFKSEYKTFDFWVEWIPEGALFFPTTLGQNRNHLWGTNNEMIKPMTSLLHLYKSCRKNITHTHTHTHAHTHTHTLSLSLFSLSNTHTHTHIYIYICIYIYVQNPKSSNIICI